jgi:hypothetical protein
MRELESLEVRAGVDVKRLAAYLMTSVRTLRTMQLPGGELPAVHWSESGEAYSAPAPLLSALAYDALAYVDPRSAQFVGRVRDLVPSSFFVDVVSLRWGLRLSIASEQSADGTWQLHGRLGARSADVATTACAAAAMLPNAKWRRARPDPRHLAALRRLESRDWTALEAAHVRRYLALIGEPMRRAEKRDASIAKSETSIAAFHAESWSGSPRPVETAPLAGPLEEALYTAALLNTNREDLDASLERILFGTTPPWRWPADPYGEHRIGSPATALALQLANVARLAALPRGGAS